MRSKAFICWLFFASILAADVGCKTSPGPFSNLAPKDVSEVMPGILQGYLTPREMPNSHALLPPPPIEGSAAFALDQDVARRAQATNDTARLKQAERDANLGFPQAANTFHEVIHLEIAPATFPNLFRLMRRVMTDAAISTAQAKNYYRRPRPFVVNRQGTCIPADEDALRSDGSYPSGHTAIGWAWALVFAEIFPEKADAILKRGMVFGESRIICNTHWQSDVEMGRLMGAAVVAKLHANPDFRIDLEAAKREVKR